jgi:hypothetical protein
MHALQKKMPSKLGKRTEEYKWALLAQVGVSFYILLQASFLLARSLSVS